MNAHFDSNHERPLDKVLNNFDASQAPQLPTESQSADLESNNLFDDDASDVDLVDDDKSEPYILDSDLGDTDMFDTDMSFPEPSKAVAPHRDTTQEEEDAYSPKDTIEVNVKQTREPFVEPKLISDVPRFYIQGVVRGQHAYLITNLLGGESETLLQPQMVWTMGRNRQTALPLQDTGLSRRHALIQFIRGEGFYLVDLNSMNGSYVNGVRIRQHHLLEDGDRVQMANTTFTFHSSRRHKTLPVIHAEIMTYLDDARSRPTSAFR